jgi:uncharacterized membrane protein YphA (DoxX/SURF4 family)
MNFDGLKWAAFFARWVLGLVFLMAGWWKVFELGAGQHARGFFVDGFADTWIPAWLLWGLGVAIPLVELAAGLFLCVGFRRREALIALGGVLVVVTYGHLLQEPLYAITSHIFPRLVLLLVVLVIPADRDRLSLDQWLVSRRPGSG